MYSNKQSSYAGAVHPQIIIREGHIFYAAYLARSCTVSGHCSPSLQDCSVVFLTTILSIYIPESQQRKLVWSKPPSPSCKALHLRCFSYFHGFRGRPNDAFYGGQSAQSFYPSSKLDLNVSRNVTFNADPKLSVRFVVTLHSS